MNKQHWNTVIAEEYASGALIQELIQTSYNLVWQKLPKKVREGGL
jgi:predicted DNA-binding protein (MmcQ/YjbR family)